MQLRAKKDGDDVAPEPLSHPPIPPSTLCTPLSLSPVRSILRRLGLLTKFGRSVTDDDIVWLFDNTAFRSSPLAPWQAEFVVAVFEREDKATTIQIVASLVAASGLAVDEAEYQTVQERLLPFLWDPRPCTTVTALLRGKELKLGPTNPSGFFTGLVRLPPCDDDSPAEVSARVGRQHNSTTSMLTFYAEPEGWGVISDVDDTIKVTMTSDPVGVLRETFLTPPTPVPGMPELYAELEALLPPGVAWFYLSASPYNLYPLLRQFRQDYFPPGTLILRDASWRTIAGLLSALTLKTEEYKVGRMRKIHSWLPKRKMIAIGDSTQSDPEAYGDLFREVPGWIQLILIRKATDVAAFGLEEKNEPRRFERAFRGIPRDRWHVFEDPGECLDIIKRALRR